jgi:hypothetical protein
MKLVKYVAHMGDGEVYSGILWGNIRLGEHLQDLDIDGRIRLTP